MSLIIFCKYSAERTEKEMLISNKYKFMSLGGEEFSVGRWFDFKAKSNSVCVCVCVHACVHSIQKGLTPLL